jgi:hypothetical protein
VSETTLTWRKACGCSGPGVTATVGRIITTDSTVGGVFFITATRYPGPVCDVCDTPWEGPRSEPAPQESAG